MDLLRELSPLVEPLSLDEAFVDLMAARRPVDLSFAGVSALVDELRTRVATVTGGLTASVGVATSKFIAKVASELAKPDGSRIVEPGTEVALLAPMSVGVIPGVGPVTAGEAGDASGSAPWPTCRGIAVDELAQTVGRAHAQGLVELAYARDDRPVEPERETKSISVEDTFETDLTDQAELRAVLHRQSRQVAARLTAAGLFARTVSIKVRLHDFSTLTRSRTLISGNRSGRRRSGRWPSHCWARSTRHGGVRLLGVGVAGLTDLLQEDLFAAEPAASGPADGSGRAAGDRRRTARPGMAARPGRRARRPRPRLGLGLGSGPGHRPLRDPRHPARAGPHLRCRRQCAPPS